MEMVYLKKLARFRATPTADGCRYRLKAMTEIEIDARRKYVRMILSNLESKIPFRISFDNQTIDSVRVVEDDDGFLLDLLEWDVDKEIGKYEPKRTYEFFVEK